MELTSVGGGLSHKEAKHLQTSFNDSLNALRGEIIALEQAIGAANPFLNSRWHLEAKGKVEGKRKRIEEEEEEVEKGDGGSSLVVDVTDEVYASDPRISMLPHVTGVKLDRLLRERREGGRYRVGIQGRTTKGEISFACHFDVEEATMRMMDLGITSIAPQAAADELSSLVEASLFTQDVTLFIMGIAEYEAFHRRRMHVFRSIIAKYPAVASLSSPASVSPSLRLFHGRPKSKSPVLLEVRASASFSSYTGVMEEQWEVLPPLASEQFLSQPDGEALLISLPQQFSHLHAVYGSDGAIEILIQLFFGGGMNARSS